MERVRWRVRRVLALRALTRDDRRPDPDRRLALLDVPVELLLPRSVARHASRLGALLFDEERAPVRVVVEPTLDIEPPLEFRAGLYVVDAGDEVVDLLSDGTFMSSGRVPISSKETDESLVVAVVFTKSSF